MHRWQIGVCKGASASYENFLHTWENWKKKRGSTLGTEEVGTSHMIFEKMKNVEIFPIVLHRASLEKIKTCHPRKIASQMVKIVLTCNIQSYGSSSWFGSIRFMNGHAFDDFSMMAFVHIKLQDWCSHECSAIICFWCIGLITFWCQFNVIYKK